METFDRLSLWSTYHNFFSDLIFLILEGVESLLLLGVLVPFFFLKFLLEPNSGFFLSLINSQTGIPSLAACLLGLHGISALQLRVGRKQHSSWAYNDLLKGHRTSVASMAPEIPPVFSCSPLSVRVKVRPVLSVTQTDVHGVLELVWRHRPFSRFG